MIEKLPPQLQAPTRKFMSTREFEGPKNPIEPDTSDRVILQYESNIRKTIAQDNGPADLNPAKGIVESADSRFEYQKSQNEERCEYFVTSKGGPMTMVSYGVSQPQGMDLVLGVLDSVDNVLKKGAIHFDREQGQESFFAGDLERLPT